MALKIDGCNCTSLRRATRRVSQLYDSRLAPIGLRATQFGILGVLDEVGEASINDLAAHLDMDRTTMGKNLRPLERRGLLAITPSPTDERARLVRLTDAGREVLKAGRPLWREAQEHFERLNGPDNTAALRQLLLAVKV